MPLKLKFHLDTLSDWDFIRKEKFRNIWEVAEIIGNMFGHKWNFEKNFEIILVKFEKHVNILEKFV